MSSARHEDIRRWRIVAPAALTLMLSGLNPAVAGAWRGVWGAAPAAAMGSALDLPSEWASPVVQGQTVVQTVRLSAGGQRLRLRLSNEFGDRALRIGHVAVALLDSAGAPLSGTAKEIRFSGEIEALVPAHAGSLSDPIALATSSGARLQVSLFLPGEPPACTCHSDGRATVSLSPTGDFIGRPFTPSSTTSARPFLTGVEVESAEPAPVVVTLGDSITDGYMSTPNTDRRWPDRLAERLAPSGAAVVNAAISGNRLLMDDVLPAYGVNALARFDRDVLSVAGVSHLVVLEGINDICGSPKLSARDLIFAYRQLIDRAHAHGLKVLLATLTPYEGAAAFRPEGEAVRQATNRWIRTQRTADGVVDFDLVLRDPDHQSRLKANLQSGDWLHPNDAGYRVMGDAVDLKLLR